jgi:hypothetical protein
MSAKSEKPEFELSAIEANRIVAPKEAERLSSLSWDTIEREYARYIIRLSERRNGMRVRHALMLGANHKA